MEIKLRNNTFILLPQKAIWWKEEQALLLSDLHIGKVMHFRKAGIAIPQAASEQNFIRLNQLMALHPIKKIIFVGDLFHSDLNSEWQSFCEWRKNYAAVDMYLIAGNHDRFPRKQYEDICLTVHEEELTLSGFTFSHHPRETPIEDEYVISGHVHPVIHLQGLAKQNLRFPCFYFGSHQSILPSFGSFTGGYAIEPQEGDQVVAIVQERLMKVQ